jgi:hypothetical protein
MPETPGEGVDTSKASDLRDTRQGAYDLVGNQKKPDDSAATEHERQQTGGSIQGSRSRPGILTFPKD